MGQRSACRKHISILGNMTLGLGLSIHWECKNKSVVVQVHAPTSVSDTGMDLDMIRLH